MWFGSKLIIMNIFSKIAYWYEKQLNRYENTKGEIVEAIHAKYKTFNYGILNLCYSPF
jgi:hypothetical protein